MDADTEITDEIHEIKNGSCLFWSNLLKCYQLYLSLFTMQLCTDDHLNLGSRALKKFAFILASKNQK